MARIGNSYSHDHLGRRPDIAPSGDIADGVEDYDDHALRYDWPRSPVRLDYIQSCCDRCERSRAEAIDVEWIEFLRAQDVYPLPVLTRPLLRAA